LLREIRKLLTIALCVVVAGEERTQIRQREDLRQAASCESDVDADKETNTVREGPLDSLCWGVVAAAFLASLIVNVVLRSRRVSFRAQSCHANVMAFGSERSFVAQTTLAVTEHACRCSCHEKRHLFPSALHKSSSHRSDCFSFKPGESSASLMAATEMEVGRVDIAVKLNVVAVCAAFVFVSAIVLGAF
jgi:hypothetical protein